MKIRHWVACSLALVAGACDSINEPTDTLPPFVPGVYSLVSIGGAPLPTMEPCSGLRADEERFILRADGTAEWHFLLTHIPTGQQSTYVAAGTYESDSDGLVKLNMTYTAGSGSRSPFEMALQRDSEGLAQTVGTTCGDVAKVKLYRLP